MSQPTTLSLKKLMVYCTYIESDSKFEYSWIIDGCLDHY